VAHPINETTVTIRGTSYQLRTDLGRDAVREMAQYVDRRMQELDPTGSIPPVKVSVLASLTIAGELIEERKSGLILTAGMEERLGRIHALLDAALSEGYHGVEAAPRPVDGRQTP